MAVLQCIETGCVLHNIQVNADSFELIVQAPKIAKMAEPGQFVMVSCAAPGRSPLLRRPLSVHDVNGETLSLLYRVVGQGTDILSHMGAQEPVSILGPLGHGFTIGNTGRHCLVGGGIGIAPLLLLAKDIAQRRPGDEILVLAGARNKHEFLALDKFKDSATVDIATDDGSAGYHGLVTALLDGLDSADQTVYTCGPTPMMKGVAMLCKKHGWACQVSLESHMACGMGACLGCAVARSGIHDGVGKYVHVCKDGPVFDAEVIWA